ncbi:MAG: DUF1566 domain-containing protein [Candidatus Nitrohelix vancouverensis]|uniref:DUF1566 domain-containing protein n=1 Tax=Candidatus Nitrohelix vancouverensis TaxID=2705534 RepID=A0A7T0C550_9BACT|nr:MAG: DUF1566 domain-containing protein [Candidatus Nitrohelix vancouverensis]
MAERFIDNGNGTITDQITGLMWQEAYSYPEKGAYFSWYDANEYIDRLNETKEGGWSDWRLPSRWEIQSLYEIAKPFQSRGKTFILHIDPIFEFSYGSCFWTRETRLSAALGFEFDRGDMHWYPRGSISGCVRAVRGQGNIEVMLGAQWASIAAGA